MVRHKKVGIKHAPADFWVPPGGGVEPNEGVNEGAEREVLEETGLIVKVNKLIHVRETIWDVKKRFDWGEPGRGLEVYLQAEVIGGTLALGSDPENISSAQTLCEVGIFTKEKLQTMPHFPGYLLDLLEKPVLPMLERIG